MPKPHLSPKLPLSSHFTSGPCEAHYTYSILTPYPPFTITITPALHPKPSQHPQQTQLFCRPFAPERVQHQSHHHPAGSAHASHSAPAWQSGRCWSQPASVRYLIEKNHLEPRTSTVRGKERKNETKLVHSSKCVESKIIAMS